MIVAVAHIAMLVVRLGWFLCGGNCGGAVLRTGFGRYSDGTEAGDHGCGA
jgi:hypothetical protein